jgi:uncharacterized membrane protein YphA (DoxX/SURF4 family)
MTLPSPPRFVISVLHAPATFIAARLALISAYVLGGVVKATDFPAAVAEQAHFGLHPPALFAAVTIGVELIGSALVMTRRWVWLGAGMLGVFTALAAITANAFWTMQGQDRFAASNAFFEHVGLVGGLVAVAVVAHPRAANGA